MKRGFTLLDLLVVIFIIALGCALSLPFVARNHTNKQPNVLQLEDSGKKVGGFTIREFNYDGCQYIKLYDGIAHKGNCTNSIHAPIPFIPAR